MVVNEIATAWGCENSILVQVTRQISRILGKQEYMSWRLKAGMGMTNKN